MKPPDDPIARILGSPLGESFEALGDALLARPAAPLAASAVLLIAGILLQFSLPLNHDVGWLLVATDRMLDGAAIYLHDVIEVNPPIVLALFAPVVALSRALALPEIPLFKLYTAALLLATLPLCNALLAQLLGDRDAQLRRLLVCALIFCHLVAAGYDFGQRDAFVFALAVPYLLGAALRATRGSQRRALAVLTGLGLGLALSLKPHYALAVVCVEAAVAVERRSLRDLFRTETLVGASTFAACTGATLLLTPGYFDVVLPLALDLYWILQRPLSQLVRAEDAFALVAAAVALAVARGGARRSLARMLVVGCASFYVVMLVQRTGMSYHRVPTAGTATLLASLAAFCLLDAFLSRSAKRGRSRTGTLAASVLGGVLALTLVAATPRAVVTLLDGAPWRAGDATGRIGELARLLDAHARGEPAQFLTTSLHPAFPALNYSDARWASRFSHLWILNAIVTARTDPRPRPARLTPARLAEIEQYLLDAIVEDLERRRPVAIVFDLREPDASTVLPTLRRDPRFDAIWQGYRVAEERVGPFRVALRP